MALNPRQRQFVIEYLIDFNGTKAAVRAGYSENGAANTAYELLSNPEIMQAIQDEQDRRASLAGLNAQWVLDQWKKIAEADPSELIWVQLEACRHCYGKDHQFQWTEFDYQQAVKIAQSHICGSKCEQPCSKKALPSIEGGFGFNPVLPPAADCPACQGQGVQRVGLADTKRLRGSARRLYAGVKQTKDGIEIKMRDQDAALMNIAKYLGMLIDKSERSGPGGGPIPLSVSVSAQDLTDDQLAAIAAQGLSAVS